MLPGDPPTGPSDADWKKMNRTKGRNRRLTHAGRPYEAGPNVANVLPGPAQPQTEPRVEERDAKFGSSGQMTKQRSKEEVSTHRVLEAYLCLKLSELIEMKWKLSDTRSYIPALERKIVPSRVKRFVSPFEFYLEFAATTYDDGRAEFFKNLQQHYNNLNNSEEWKLIKGKVMRGRCYVCKDSNGNWNRVRACSVDDVKKIVIVFSCDDITMHEVPYSSLLELDARFTSYSAQMIRAHLYDILPKGSDGVTWSEEACNQVKELLMGKVFDTLILTRSDEDVRNGLPDVISNVGVVLYEKWTGGRNGPSAEAVGASCSINAQLVDAGFAQSIGIFAGCKHSLISENVPETVCDMAELKRRYPLLLEKLDEVFDANAIVSFHFPEKLNGKYLHSVVRNGLSVKGPAENQWGPLRREVPSAPVPEGKNEFLPETFGNRLAHIKLSFISGPECMIVHLYSQIKAMHRMQLALKHASYEQPPLAYGKVKQGTFIVVEMVDKNESIWCRAVVKLLQPQSKTFKVMLVDYGNEVTIRPSQSRILPEFFHNIPSFAHRVHLDVLGLTPFVGFGWNSDCCVNFRKYTFSWEDKDPIYYMHRPGHSESIELTDFTQDVTYNAEQGKWMAGPTKKISAHQPVNSIKTHPMLRSLFNSVGVEIYYEVMMEESPFWHFEPLGNNLVETGFGKYEEKPREKLKVHTQIADSCYPIPVQRSPELGPLDVNPAAPSPASRPRSSGQGENQGNERKTETTMQPVNGENSISTPRSRVRRAGVKQRVFNDFKSKQTFPDWSDSDASVRDLAVSDDDDGIEGTY